MDALWHAELYCTGPTTTNVYITIFHASDVDIMNSLDDNLELFRRISLTRGKDRNQLWSLFRIIVAHFVHSFILYKK